MIRRLTEPYLPRQQRLLLTCCGEPVASFTVVEDEPHPRINGTVGNVLVSTEDHDGVSYTQTPSGSLLFENSAGESHHGKDGIKIHVKCRKCPLDLQMTEDNLMQVMTSLRGHEVTGDVRLSELTITAKRMGDLLGSLPDR